MAIQYRCKEGDMLDEICHHYYGRTAGAVEQVLAANPGLAQLGPEPPIGTLIHLPELALPETEQVNIWA